MFAVATAVCALNFRPIVRSRPIVAQLSDAASDNWANLKNMPPKLAEWGCTDELWAIARNKKRLVQWAEEGDAVAEQVDPHTDERTVSSQVWQAPAPDAARDALGLLLRRQPAPTVQDPKEE